MNHDDKDVLALVADTLGSINELFSALCRQTNALSPRMSNAILRLDKAMTALESLRIGEVL